MAKGMLIKKKNRHPKVSANIPASMAPIAGAIIAGNATYPIVFGSFSVGVICARNALADIPIIPALKPWVNLEINRASKDSLKKQAAEAVPKRNIPVSSEAFVSQMEEIQGINGIIMKTPHM